VDPGGSHLEQFELAERQLLVVFAREINHFHQAERAARPSWNGPWAACAGRTWT
jgi:hypothetical protein